MRRLAPTAASCLALAVLATGAHAGERVGNILPPSGFEHGQPGVSALGTAHVARSRRTAHAGRWSLRVTARRHGDAGASIFAPGNVLQARGFLSPITGALRGTYDASVWVRAIGPAVGAPLRVQVNELGGATGEEVLGTAVKSTRLTSHWRRVHVHGSVRRPDRTGVALLFFIQEANRGDTFFADTARLGGDPLGGVTVQRRGRWRGWEYAGVWVLVLAGGAAWLIPARRRKTARLRTP